MKRVSLIFVVSAIFFVSFPAYSQLLDKSKATEIYVAWVDGPAAEQAQIYLAHYGDSGWSKPDMVTNTPGFKQSPSCYIGSDDTIHLAWVEGEGQDSRIVYTKKTGDMWQDISAIHAVGIQSNTTPALTERADGSPCIVWVRNDGNDDDIFFSQKNETGWTQPLRVHSDNLIPDIDPAIITDGEKIITVWCVLDNLRLRLRCAAYSGKEWKEEGFVYDSAASQEFPALVRASDGTIHLLWWEGQFLCSAAYSENGWTLESKALPGFDYTSFIQGIRTGTSTVAAISWEIGTSVRNAMKYRFVNPLFSGLQETKKVYASRQPGKSSIFDFFDSAYAATNDITAFGDSITSGYGSTDGGYPPRLSGILERPVLNRGREGERAVAALSRFRSVISQDRPGIALIWEGTNDLGDGKSTSSVMAALGSMIDIAREYGAVPIIATLLPRNDIFNSGAARYSAAIRDLAAQKGIALCDQSAVFSGLDFDLYFFDKIHPNNTGYDLAASTWAATIRPPAPSSGGGGGGCGYLHFGSSPGDWMSMGLIYLVVLLMFVRRLFVLSMTKRRT